MKHASLSLALLLRLGLALVVGGIATAPPAHATSAAAPAASAPQAAAEADAFAAGLRAAADAYGAGDPLAAAEVGDLFYRFEESRFRDLLAAREPDLYRRFEAEWLALRREMKAGTPPAEVHRQVEAFAATIERAKGAAGVVSSGSVLFWGSFLIIFREGFEALLIVAALAAYLRKTGGESRLRDLYGGVLAAVVASLALWTATKTVLHLSGSDTEALEGVTMLLATVVLFYVSYWLVSKVQHAKWEAFVRRRMAGAVASGSRLALFGVAFLVVFREGLETVLFYEALGASAGGGGVATLVAGFVAGLVVLAFVYGGIRFAGARLPIGRFFAVTSALLYWMAFKFAGDGVRELQEAGWVGETHLTFVPSGGWTEIWLGIHPFLETLVLQGILLVALAIALVLALRPRAEAREGEAVGTESRAAHG